MSGVASSARRIATAAATTSDSAETRLIACLVSQLEASRTDPEALHRAAVPVRETQPEIPDRCFTGSLQMSIATTGAAAHGHHRQRAGGVDIGIPHSSAIDDQRVIEERPITIGCRAQLLQELHEELRMIRVDPGYLSDLV